MLLYSRCDGGVRVAAVSGDQLGDDVDGDGEHDGGVVLRGDAVQGLQIPEHQGSKQTPFFILIYDFNSCSLQFAHYTRWRKCIIYLLNVACNYV